ncbi:MAG: EAL domain-containing protein [Prochlorococcaceae cyanobacterium]|jgi:EAL domain-containing protein (putative c-di-GMP-specific phosphodiesterase class I)
MTRPEDSAQSEEFGHSSPEPGPESGGEADPRQGDPSPPAALETHRHTQLPRKLLRAAPRPYLQALEEFSQPSRVDAWLPDLHDLLEKELLDIHFQPILSLRQKAVVGVEALARPHRMRVGEMFAKAAAAGRLLELDQLCRRKALESYRLLSTVGRTRPLLFVNFEASVIDRAVVNSGTLLSSVEAHGLRPSDIVIEVNESKVLDPDSLRQFVDCHRDLGFLIALDDLGAGDSNLPRIAQLRPHIIKLDRNLIAGIDHDFFKQQTVKSLVNLCRSIGSLVLAEGVETLEEVDACASLGAELFQGFHFDRPKAPVHLDFPSLLPALVNASQRQREHAVDSLQARRLVGSVLHKLAGDACERLKITDPAHFDSVLQELVQSDEGIEATYLLDSHGLQVSHTHMTHLVSGLPSRLFGPASRGTDHSYKEYFFSLIHAGLQRYTTDSYISLATGQPCRTVTVVFDHISGQSFVLCIDFKATT